MSYLTADWRQIKWLQANVLLGGHIADGGFSELWKGELLLGSKEQDVAVKVVDLKRSDLEASLAKVLKGEAKFLDLLQHPSILKCHKVLHTRQHLVMVLQFCSGGEVLEHLHLVHQYSEVQAAGIFCQVVDAVKFMHSLSIMHRDIKPENVLFYRPVQYYQAKGKTPKVKLIDLGMAAVYDPMYPTSGCMGSPGFMAPEVVRGEEHTPAADVYALGVLLFCMLTGAKPFLTSSIRSLQYAFMSISEAPGIRDQRFQSLSSDARSLLLAMLADDPIARPTSAAVLQHTFTLHRTAERSAPLDQVVRHKILELAATRRFKGLGFALMMLKQEGIHGARFLEQVTARRKALHQSLEAKRKSRESNAPRGKAGGEKGSADELRQEGRLLADVSEARRQRQHLLPGGHAASHVQLIPLQEGEEKEEETPFLQAGTRHAYHHHKAAAHRTPPASPSAAASAATACSTTAAAGGRAAESTSAGRPMGQHASARSVSCRSHVSSGRAEADAELAWAARDPLALLSCLPIFSHAHSAPVPASGSWLLQPPQRHDGTGAVRPHGRMQDAGGDGRVPGMGVHEHGAQKHVLPCDDRGSNGGGRYGQSSQLPQMLLDLGVDVRAMSLNPQTLDMLGNAELLAGLTGICLNGEDGTATSASTDTFDALDALSAMLEESIHGRNYGKASSRQSLYTTQAVARGSGSGLLASVTSSTPGSALKATTPAWLGSVSEHSLTHGQIPHRQPERGCATDDGGSTGSALTNTGGKMLHGSSLARSASMGGGSGHDSMEGGVHAFNSGGSSSTQHCSQAGTLEHAIQLFAGSQLMLASDVPAVDATLAPLGLSPSTSQLNLLQTPSMTPTQPSMTPTQPSTHGLTLTSLSAFASAQAQRGATTGNASTGVSCSGQRHFIPYALDALSHRQNKSRSGKSPSAMCIPKPTDLPSSSSLQEGVSSDAVLNSSVHGNRRSGTGAGTGSAVDPLMCQLSQRKRQQLHTFLLRAQSMRLQQMMHEHAGQHAPHARMSVDGGTAPYSSIAAIHTQRTQLVQELQHGAPNSRHPTTQASSGAMSKDQGASDPATGHAGMQLAAQTSSQSSGYMVADASTGAAQHGPTQLLWWFNQAYHTTSLPYSPSSNASVSTAGGLQACLRVLGVRQSLQTGGVGGSGSLRVVQGFEQQAAITYQHGQALEGSSMHSTLLYGAGHAVAGTDQAEMQQPVNEAMDQMQPVLESGLGSPVGFTHSYTLKEQMAVQVQLIADAMPVDLPSHNDPWFNGQGRTALLDEGHQRSAGTGSVSALSAQESRCSSSGNDRGAVDSTAHKHNVLQGVKGSRKGAAAPRRPMNLQKLPSPFGGAPAF